MELCCGQGRRLTAPAVLPAVSNQDVRLGQRRGTKLLGQPNLTRKGGGRSASRRRDCQHQGGREPGSGGLVNSCEAALNAVSDDRRKMLTRLSQNRHVVRPADSELLRRRRRTTGGERRPPPPWYISGTW